ncbi:TAXI family TRAP transporter solute-binding subunit [Chelativorans sp. YIM 93263]|uniref:TAXI family TRAP transporter solute-binding subunit n=1 Tax=Chelativorans sp. YIM 93263 TaxID=2906648 RepID=UPI002377E38B|nr:TAXI family TRAP transporter solute-binding subunit [Chelativorans sp. YIM 93263]
MMKLRNALYLAAATTAVSAVTLATIQPADAQRQSMRWNTSDVGSYGYAVASSMVDLLDQALGDEYTVTVHPYPSTTAAKIATMDGDGEISYTADVGMRQLYDRSGPFEGYEPTTGELVHTFYAYPMETFLVVSSDRADEFDSWSDFAGEPVFYTPAGFMNWLNMGRIFNALELDQNHVEIDSATTADALEAGSIVGAAAYTTAGASLPTYWREAELRADVTAVNPTDEEIERMRAAGLSVVEINPSTAFSQDLGVDTVYAVPIFFGYNVRADMDEEIVYDMLTVFHDNIDALVEGDPGFRPLAEDFVGTQAAGVAGNPDIPVHPGLARFLQEHDAWDDSWTIADDQS